MKSLPLSVREINATEARLQSIYDAAKLGLKGDALALSAGMQPLEFRRLCELDPLADLAAQKGKADAERELAEILHAAARGGDSKAALAILQHVHGWTAKQSIEVTTANQLHLDALRNVTVDAIVDALPEPESIADDADE
jgi:hypothetical protein